MAVIQKQDGEDLVWFVNSRQTGARDVEALRLGQAVDGTAQVTIKADVTFEGDTGGDSPLASDIPLVDASSLVDATNVEAAISSDIAKGNGLKALAPVRRVRAETSANMASFSAVSTTLDGLTLVEGDRVLVRAQSTPAENGIYVVGAVAAAAANWTRAADMAAAAVIPNKTIVLVDAGTLGAGKVRQITNAGTVTIATTGLTFTRLVKAPDLILCSATVGAEGAVAANAIEVACALVDADGVAITTQPKVHIEAHAVTDDKGDLAAAGTPVGTVDQAINPAAGANKMVMTPSAGGLFSFRVTDDVAEKVLVTIQPDGGFPRTLVLTFA